MYQYIFIRVCVYITNHNHIKYNIYELVTRDVCMTIGEMFEMSHFSDIALLQNPRDLKPNNFLNTVVMTH